MKKGKRSEHATQHANTYLSQIMLGEGGRGGGGERGEHWMSEGQVWSGADEKHGKIREIFLIFPSEKSKQLFIYLF